YNMSQSLSKIYVHVVFSTKYIQKKITAEVRAELQAYIVGCLADVKSYTEEIYINPDHLHVLCTLPRTLTIAQLVSKIKTPSSMWLKQKGVLDFEWQGGYGTFSVSASNVDAVKRYIQNQSEHHKKVDFKDELRMFFEKYKIEYDEKYVWD
ncbi:MAG: IS200/IS605 family transposase, partial [Bacteroidales bacterium]